jgi:hypothetical protein
MKQLNLGLADLPFFENWSFEYCEFCWRMVPLPSNHADWPDKILCLEHRGLSSSDSEYRKCRSLLAEAQSLSYELDSELRLTYPDRMNGQDAVILARDLFFMTAPESPLEYVRDYLYKRTKGSCDLKVLIWALNASVRGKLELEARDALDWKLQEHLEFPTLAFMVQLSRAETWLRLMNRDRRYKN